MPDIAHFSVMSMSNTNEFHLEKDHFPYIPIPLPFRTSVNQALPSALHAARNNLFGHFSVKINFKAKLTDLT